MSLAPCPGPARPDMFGGRPLPSLSLLCGLPKGCLDMGQPALLGPAWAQNCSPAHPQPPDTGLTPKLPTPNPAGTGHSPLSCSPGETPALRWQRSQTLRRIPARGGSQVRAPQRMAAQDACHTKRGTTRSTAGELIPPFRFIPVSKG